MVPETEAHLVFSWSQKIHPLESADVTDLRGALTISCDRQSDFSCSTCDSIYKRLRQTSVVKVGEDQELTGRHQLVEPFEDLILLFQINGRLM